MKKWQIIDLARSFSILSVMAFHVEKFLRPPVADWQGQLWWHFMRNGAYGVPVFFMVSGFLITGVIAGNRGGLWKPDFRRFYAQRAGRILPLFLFTVWFGGVLLFSNDQSLKFAYFYRFRSADPLFWASLATFTFNWWFLSPQALLDYGVHWAVLWSLSIEEQFYLGFPLLLKKLGRPRNLGIFLGGLILCALLYRMGAYRYDPTNRGLLFYNSLAQFDMIAMGVLLYLAHRRFSSSLSRSPWTCTLLCLTGAALFLGFFWFGDAFDTRTGIYANDVMGLGLFGFLLGGIQLPVFESAALKGLSLPGKYCYGNYLIHPTMIFLLQPLLSGMGIFPAFLFFALVTTVVAGLSYRFFEMPANHLIRARFGAK